MEGKAGVSGFRSCSISRMHGLGGDVLGDFGRADTGFWFSFSTGTRRRLLISLSDSRTQHPFIHIRSNVCMLLFRKSRQQSRYTI